jgi:MFS family permease
MLTSTLVGMTISLALPLLSLALERAGVDSFTIGLNTAANGLGVFLVAPFARRLVARLGVAGCFRVGLLTAAACMLVFPLWIDPWFWFGLRLVFSMAASMMFILSETAVNALAPEAIRGRVLGVYATLFSLGFVAGPLVLSLAGSEGWTPYLLGAALFLSGLLPVRMLATVQHRLQPEGGGSHRLVDTWRVAPLAMGGVFVYALLEASQFALLPLYALDRGMDEATAAALLSIWLSGNILFQYPLGWLADRWSRRAVMACCTVAALAGQLLVPGAMDTPLLLWPLLVLLGGLMGGLYTLALALVGQRFRGADLTSANTAFVMTFQLGAIAGPPYAGAVMQLLGVAVFPLTLLPPLAILAVALVGRLGALAVAGRRP